MAITTSQPSTAVSERSPSSAIDGFLDEARRVVAVDHRNPRLVFALDATMSRQPTWDVASVVQREMFEATASIGGLSVQLVYFRGMGECRSSGWVADPRSLAGLMGRIRCESGATQIGRVLSHVGREAANAPVKALLYVGDAIEEDLDDLCAKAGELALKGVKAFMFHEGDGPGVALGFARVAYLTGGAALAFDGRAPASLAALLRAVAAYASGGDEGLHRLASRDQAAVRLIAAMPSRPARS